MPANIFCVTKKIPEGVRFGGLSFWTLVVVEGCPTAFWPWGGLQCPQVGWELGGRPTTDYLFAA